MRQLIDSWYRALPPEYRLISAARGALSVADEEARVDLWRSTLLPFLNGRREVPIDFPADPRWRGGPLRGLKIGQSGPSSVPIDTSDSVWLAQKLARAWGYLSVAARAQLTGGHAPNFTIAGTGWTFDAPFDDPVKRRRAIVHVFFYEALEVAGAVPAAGNGGAAPALIRGAAGGAAPGANTPAAPSDDWSWFQDLARRLVALVEVVNEVLAHPHTAADLCEELAGLRAAIKAVGWEHRLPTAGSAGPAITVDDLIAEGGVAAALTGLTSFLAIPPGEPFTSAVPERLHKQLLPALAASDPSAQLAAVAMLLRIVDVPYRDDPRHGRTYLKTTV